MEQISSIRFNKFVYLGLATTSMTIGFILVGLYAPVFIAPVYATMKTGEKIITKKILENNQEKLLLAVEARYKLRKMILLSGLITVGVLGITLGLNEYLESNPNKRFLAKTFKYLRHISPVVTPLIDSNRPFQGPIYLPYFGPENFIPVATEFFLSPRQIFILTDIIKSGELPSNISVEFLRVMIDNIAKTAPQI